jgi:hypothetical protein
LAKILIERIGLDKKELELISNKYSVSALQLVERFHMVNTGLFMKIK